MKKITNKLLFSGLAVVIAFYCIFVISVITTSCVYNEKNDGHDSRSTTESQVTRDLEAFDAIENEGMCDIVYVQSEKSAVEITAPARYIDRFETDVDDGVLRIDVLGKIRGRNAEKFSIKVYSPTCRSIKNDGVGKISCDSLYSDTLIVKNEGVGSIELKKLSVSHLKADNEGVGAISVEVIDAEYVHLDNEGVGSVSISGKAEKAKLVNEGIGEIDASGLDCEDIGLSNEGLGNIVTKE